MIIYDQIINISAAKFTLKGLKDVSTHKELFDYFYR